MLKQTPIEQISNPHRSVSQKDIPIAYRQAAAAAGKIHEPSFCKYGKDGIVLLSNPAPWLTAQLLQFDTIPTYILAENYEDYLPYRAGSNLNPIDIAELNQKILDEQGITKTELAAKLNVDRTTLSHNQRLLKLAEPLKQAVRTGAVTVCFARCFASFDKEHQKSLFTKYTLIEKPKSIRELESVLAQERQGKKSKFKKDVSIVAFEKKLSEIVGHPISINDNQLKVEFSGLESLESILMKFGLPTR